MTDSMTAVVSKVDSESFVCCLSKSAYGTGVNLVRASRIIMMTLHWNPAEDTQCVGRCCRLGQVPKKERMTVLKVDNVIVYRLVSTASSKPCLDEKILQIQSIKLAETTAVMKGEGNSEEVKKQMYEVITAQ